MKPRWVIDTDVTPAGGSIELAREGGHYVVRIDGHSLMSSAMYGSEQAMAALAAERLGRKRGTRVLVGGLGMGFTLRAALDAFGADADITVAELLPAVVRFNRGELGDLAQRPLDDPRVTLVMGDVADLVGDGTWDAVLLDVDNGPEAFTVPGNASLYDTGGIKRLASALAPGGVGVLWSAFPSPSFEAAVRRQGLRLEVRKVRARAGKGPRHILFIIEPGPRR